MRRNQKQKGDSFAQTWVIPRFVGRRLGGKKRNHQKDLQELVPKEGPCLEWAWWLDQLNNHHWEYCLKAQEWYEACTIERVALPATLTLCNPMDCSPPDFSVYGIFPGKDTGKERKVKSLSCVQLFATPWTVAYQAPPSMEFSKQEYRSGLPFPSPEDLPDLGIEPRSPTL